MGNLNVGKFNQGNLTLGIPTLGNLTLDYPSLCNLTFLGEYFTGAFYPWTIILLFTTVLIHI